MKKSIESTQKTTSQPQEDPDFVKWKEQKNSEQNKAGTISVIGAKAGGNILCFSSNSGSTISADGAEAGGSIIAETGVNAIDNAARIVDQMDWSNNF